MVRRNSLKARTVGAGGRRNGTRAGNARLTDLTNIGSDAPLTAREVQCLHLLADGMRSGQIAFALKVARVTVDFHITNAKAKLKANTREQAVALAIRGGLLGP